MNRTILIVDDDPMIRKLIATTLEDISGYRLQEAGDGLEAVERAQATRPEIVFLDVDMPRLNGIEACRRLRSDPATARATIVMLTGDSGDIVERGAQAAGRGPLPHQAVLAAAPAAVGRPDRRDALSRRARISSSGGGEARSSRSRAGARAFDA